MGIRRSLKADERGATIVMGISVFVLFALLGVLAIDIAALKVTARQVQTTADSIALAATNELDGTRIGWRASKRAAFLMLRENEILGSSGDVHSPSEFGIIADTDIDPQETVSQYRSTEYTIGDIHVIIERGYYGSFDGGNTFQFVKLDGDADSEIDDSVIGNIDRYDCPCAVWEVANATRVNLTLSDVDLFFAQILPGGSTSFSAIVRRTVSARDDFSLNI